MVKTTIYLISLFSLIFLLLIFLTLMSKKSKMKREKSSPFECGFNFFNLARSPFSMRFFLIAIIFIIFDVEITLMLPLISTILISNIFKWWLTSNIFIFILMIGTLIEWKEKSFEWKSNSKE